jgi:hypothetical protein
MTRPRHIAFEFVDDIAVFRPVGQHTLAQGIRLVREAIAHAREQGNAKLLVDLIELIGFDSPSIAARHSMVRDWAGAAHGAVKVAMVCRLEVIDPDKFGVTAAANFGLVSDVFVTRDEAIAWLRSLK